MPNITFLCDEVDNHINIATDTNTPRMKSAIVNSRVLSSHDVSSPHSGVQFREFKANHTHIPDCSNYKKRLQSLIDTIQDPDGPWLSLLKSDATETATLIRRLEQLKQQFERFYNAKIKRLKKLRFGISNSYSRNKTLMAKFHAEMFEYFHKTLIPQIVEISCCTAEELRIAEIRYTSKRGRPALLHVYPSVNTTHHNSLPRYVSYQKSIGRYTQNQLTYLGKTPAEQVYFKNCYDRFETGVANMQWQVAGHIHTNDSGEKYTQLSSAILRHSNIYRTQTNDPLPKQYYETVLDAEQIIETAAEKVFIDRCQDQDPAAIAAQHDASNPMPITLHELRLLSVLNEKLDSVDIDQRARWQMENNFIAFNLCQNRTMQVKVIDKQQQEHTLWVKPDIALSDFGVNIMRHEELNDPLQDWMNTRALNKLWQDVCNKLPGGTSLDILQNIEADGDLKNALTAMQLNQQQLDIRYHSFLANVQAHHQERKPEIIDKLRKEREELLKLEAQHYLLEKQVLDLRFKLFNTKKDELLNAIDNPFPSTQNGRVEKSLLQLWLNVLTLFNDASYTEAENTYLLQASWSLLAQQLGTVFATGCNDNKDRGSREAEKIEALTIFCKENHCYPRLYDPTFEQRDRDKLYRIEAIVHERSTALYGTELSSVPGCLGEHVRAPDGNAHLNLLHCYQAEVGKGFTYKLPKVKILDYVSVGCAFVWCKITETIRDILQTANPMTMTVPIIASQPTIPLAPPLDEQEEQLGDKSDARSILHHRASEELQTSPSTTLTPTQISSDVDAQNKANTTASLGHLNRLDAFNNNNTLFQQDTPFKQINQANQRKWQQFNQAMLTGQKNSELSTQSALCLNDIKTQINSNSMGNHRSAHYFYGASPAKVSAVRFYNAQKIKPELPTSLPPGYFYTTDNYSNPSLS